MRFLARFTVCLPLLLASMLNCAAQKSTSPYIAEIDAWHAERVERLQSETGWLTLVGLHPLREGINTLGPAEGMDVRLIEKAPTRVGTLIVEAGNVTLQVAEGIDVRVEGGPDEAPIGAYSLAADAEGQPTVLNLGSLLFHVIERGDQLLLRVKDRQSEVLRSFSSIERFEADARWRSEARLVADDSTRTIAVPNVLRQVSESPCPGLLVFELNGQACHLAPIGETGKSMLIVFGDETNGTGTYGGGRFLSAPPPDSTGTVVLDFNKAVNPPCAFTPYATCPLPPEGNVLPVAVEAGEKAWDHH